mgnify:CR=1 FL=1
MLQEGTLAPDFTLLSDGGVKVTLSQYRGKKVVLYFYPKDNTPGCTTEACGFRDSYAEILAAGAVVLGVSPDPVQSHDKFKLQFNLPFALLSDPDHRVAEMYGTFIIDEAGKIIKVFPKVTPEGHSEQVLAVLKAVTPS